MTVVRKQGGKVALIRVSNDYAVRQVAREAWTKRLAEQRSRVGKLCGGAKKYALARELDRPIGRGGGMRDGSNRTAYVTFAVSEFNRAVIGRLAAERGLSRAAFVGMCIEGCLSLDEDRFDEILAAAAE